jgi:hypothetical protein
MRNILASALLFAAACASTSQTRPADIAQPEISVRSAGPVYISQSSTPLTIEVTVTNKANVPLAIKEVEVSSLGAEQYQIPPASRLYQNETVAPGETRTVSLSARAVANDTRSRVGNPLQVRTFVRFEANGKTFREVVIEQFSPLS